MPCDSVTPEELPLSEPGAVTFARMVAAVWLPPGDEISVFKKIGDFKNIFGLEKNSVKNKTFDILLE